MARLYPSHSIDQLLQSGLRHSSMSSRQLCSRRFAEPSRQAIHVLRRQRGEVVLLPQDLEGTGHLLPVDRTNLALEHARARTQPLSSFGR
jgi:hypothetical protein